MTQGHDGRTTIPISSIPLGTEGPQVFFLHANAYPPECYRSLLELLARDFRVHAMLMRPLWKESGPGTMHSWHLLSADFLAWLELRSSGPAMVMGHSLGAIVALRAALQDPSRFRGLVLLDPVLLTPLQIELWRLMRHLPAGHRLHSAIRRAENRRSVFSDTDEVFAAYRRHPVFRRLSDAQLQEVIRGLVEASEGHVQLRYGRDWEARIYATAAWDDRDLWKELPTLSVPTLIVRGAESDTLTVAACEAARRANPRIQIATIDQATHLVPLERPLEVHLLAHDFVQRACRPDHGGPSDGGHKRARTNIA